MRNLTTVNGELLRRVGLHLLWAVHVWTGRRYHRAVIGRELKQIGLQVAAERRARERAEELNAEMSGPGADCSEGMKRRAI
jgi:hypothetical protein